MKRFSIFLTLLCIAALLGACAKEATSPGPSSTQANTEVDVVEAISSLICDASSLQDPALAEAAIAAAQLPFNAPGCPEVDLVFDLIGFSSKGNLQAQTTGGTVLARGTFEYDTDSGMCIQVSEGDDLTLTFPYQNFAGDLAIGDLHIDWDVDSDTLDVANPAGDLVEVPTDMSASLKVSSIEAANVSVALSWYNIAGCGTDDGVLEPLSVRVSGQIGMLNVADIGYAIDKNSLDISGALSALQGFDAEAKLEVKGKTERQDCYIDSFEVDKGSFSALVDSTLQADSHSFSLDVNLGDAKFADFEIDLDDMSFGTIQGLSAVTLKNGKLRIDNKKAADIAGVLDDSNANGVSGENVTLNFTAGGSTDLESFLTKNDFGINLP